MINIPEEEIFDTEEINWLKAYAKVEVVDAVANALTLYPIRFEDIKMLIVNLDYNVNPGIIMSFARNRSRILHFLESEEDNNK